jgi:formyltetrahydrofolate hydrolase
MPKWKISKILTDLIWETMKEQLRGKLRTVVENKDQWDDISERIRIALIAQLNHKKVSHAAPKKLECDKKAVAK